MRRAVHLWKLIREFGRYSVANRAYWVVPFIMLLISIAAVVGLVQTAVPFTLYALF